MPDWGKLADKGIDAVGDGIDKAKEKVGEGVDWATDKVGDGLDHMGQHKMADVVEDWGDRTASSLGAEVGEQQLGESEQANELIHGNPGKIAESVKNLRDFQKAFDLVGGGMKKLDSSHWKGEAADTFRDEFQTLPTDWLYAADAFEDAAKALETYSKSITSAQDKAREAIALYREGDESSKTATDEHNKKVDAYNAARNGDHPLPDPGELSDPGQAKRERAQEVLKEARRHRNEAAETAKTAVTAAMAHAPKEPTGRERLNLEVMDYSLGQSFELAHFGGGVVKGTAGLLNFVRSVDPMDPYNLTHPAEYCKGVNMTLAGLASTAANPDRALKNAWDAAKGDPSEFLGRLVPELAGTKGTGLARGGIRAGMRNGVKQGLEQGAEAGVKHGPFDNLASRGSGADLPPFEEVKRAVAESNPEIVSRKWPDDDGRYYASRVLKGGRPDGETVLAGHGYIETGAGEVVVPPGTNLSFYVAHGERIPGLNGVAVEGGSYPGAAVETFGPGDRIPNYTLAPPEPKGPGGFTVYENSKTVAQRTMLSDLLKSDMGNVHWAACREFK
ncbi:WXG100 family type VII secretion target [Streptomyces sp. NBC_01750]|uniref:WXG100 family type VII secretion target n=1 Tax=Streptomyces sp. NBC_01750 TaxID=2975928 RepID=UPI003FA3A02C